MAYLHDIKVGQKIQIVKGTTSTEDFSAGYDLDYFIGKQTTVKQIDSKDKYCTVRTGSETKSFWFPLDWIKIIKEEKEQPVNTEKTTKDVKTKYAVLDVVDNSGISDYFEDISQVFEVMGKWRGYDQWEAVEFFEKGYYKIIEVKELDVKIEVPKPVIKIVG